MPVFLALLLFANLLVPLAPLAPSGAQAAGLTAANSIVICTDGGFRRVALADLGTDGIPADAPEDCSEFCSLCVIALSAQVLLAPGFSFVLQAGNHATRMSIRTSDRFLAAANPTRNRARAPPAFS